MKKIKLSQMNKLLVGQRKRYVKGKLDEHSIKMLDNLGIGWRKGLVVKK